MRSFFMVVALSFVSELSFATEAIITKSDKEFDLYNVDTGENNSVTVSFFKTIETQDMCNTFSISGDVKKVENTDLFVADFDVISTKMHCTTTGSRRISLKSAYHTVGKESGGSFSILVPKEFGLATHK